MGKSAGEDCMAGNAVRLRQVYFGREILGCLKEGEIYE